MAEDQLQDRVGSGPATEQGPEYKTPASWVSPRSEGTWPSSRPSAKMLLGARVLAACSPSSNEGVPFGPIELMWKGSGQFPAEL